VVYTAFTSARRRRESRRRRHMSEQAASLTVPDVHCNEISGGVIRYRQNDEEKLVSMAPRVAFTHIEVVGKGERQAAAKGKPLCRRARSYWHDGSVLHRKAQGAMYSLWHTRATGVLCPTMHSPARPPPAEPWRT
jgi:hypothetical protein